MTSRAVASQDNTKRITNYMCGFCLKRILVTEPNPVTAVEHKIPSGVIVHNPHTKRHKIPVIKATGNVITQNAIDEAIEDAEERGNGQ